MSVVRRFVIIGVSVCGLVAGGYLLWPKTDTTITRPAKPTERQQAKTETSAAQPVMSLDPGPPTKLDIPRLAVSAKVIPASILPSGEMATPANPTDAAWYKQGYVPGSLGNAVIAAHNLYESKPALFYRLHELAAGDEVLVTNDQGRALRFRVSDLKTYGADAVPADVFGKSDTSQLRLITCGGIWDRTQQRYTERIVITAIFQDEHQAAS